MASDLTNFVILDDDVEAGVGFEGNFEHSPGWAIGSCWVAAALGPWAQMLSRASRKLRISRWLRFRMRCQRQATCKHLLSDKCTAGGSLRHLRRRHSGWVESMATSAHSSGKIRWCRRILDCNDCFRRTNARTENDLRRTCAPTTGEPSEAAWR